LSEHFVDYILHAFLNDSSLSSNGRAAHYPSFVIEVTQNYEDASAFGTQSVLNRHLDVVKCDKGSTSCRRVAGLDWFSLYTLATLDKHHSEAIFGLATDGEAERRQC
jgi:hypothetical protein